MIRLLSALALTLIAFAHQPPRFTTPQTGLAAAYTLPDGTVPVICGWSTAGSDKGDGRASAGKGCEACRLTASVWMAPPPCDGCLELAGPHHEPAAGEAPVIAWRAFSPAAPPTAPPLA